VQEQPEQGPQERVQQALEQRVRAQQELALEPEQLAQVQAVLVQWVE
jgi:hypothetical protein